MISLKKHLDSLDDRGLVSVELELSYKSALEGIEQSLPSVSERLVSQYRRLIRELSVQFDRERSVAAIKEVRQKLAEHLKAFASQADKLLEYKDQQFKEILRSFAEVATTLAKQGTSNDERLTGFTRNLESLIDIQDLAEIRKRLAKEVAGLKQVVAEIHDKSRDSVKQLRAELSQFQEKLAYTEEIARTDALTGVRNRRSGEQAVRAAIAAGKRFSIVLLDVNGFKGINDHWGHPAGDFVLKHFASRLAAAVRTGDVVCRWGGDEFLVVLPQCNLDQAVMRGQEFARACEGEYRLSIANQQITLRLRAALGIAEWHTGETGDGLIQRADEALYKAKGNRRGLARGALYDAFPASDSGIQ
jgi:diguanylate cyclase (GGDEF)-like protein